MTRKDGTERFAYVSRGLGGIGADYADTRGHHLSSYSRDLDGFIREHAECSDGALVVDLLPIADRDDSASLVWKAPLCDPTLADGQVSRPLQGLKDDLGFAPVIGGNYFGLPGVEAVLRAASATETDDAGPLDSVSPSRLAAYWRSHGARVRLCWDGSISWEDGNA